MSCNFSNVKKRSLIHNELLPAFVSIFDMLQIMYRNAKIIYQEFIFFALKKLLLGNEDVRDKINHRHE